MNTPLETHPSDRDDRWLEDRFRAAADAVQADADPRRALDGCRVDRPRRHARAWALAAAAAALVALVGALIAAGNRSHDTPRAVSNTPELVVPPSPVPDDDSVTRAPVTEAPALIAPTATAPAVTSYAPAPTTAVATVDQTAPATTAAAAANTAPAAYKFAEVEPLPSCPADTNGEPAGKWENSATAGAWYVQPDGTCIAIEVEWADDKPADAAPLDLRNYPDVYLRVVDGAQEIYARVAPGAESYHPEGGWVMLRARADAPTADVVAFIIVPSY